MCSPYSAKSTKSYELIHEVFVGRSCDEENLRIPQGTQFGGETVRLSCGHSPANNQTYTPYVPQVYSNHMQYGGVRWATAIKPSAAEVVPKSVAGSSFPAASSTLLPFDVQICAEVSCVQVMTQADWMLLYVVPTGRVVVPTGRYVVPAGKVIIIVSPGRLSLVPTGRILSPDRVK
ncbi:hypothetical protein Tco_0680633 [Tanacetum coccineum]|uniref:Mannose-6-phosphate isomerase n=1 Tax=Tanacetum coccineum TaxID=301880 RepID=A0ABQ4XL36_9ASTR